MPLTPEETQQIERCKRGVQHLHDGVAEFFAGQPFKEKPGSQADNEHKTYAWPESISSAWGAGHLLLEYGAEHVSAFLKILMSPMEPAAAYTCVRSMMEACGISAWLVDPSIDAQTRSQRTFAYRYECMDQELTFHRMSRNDPALIAQIEGRINQVEQHALQRGFMPVVNRKGKRIGIGMQMPSATDMIDKMLDDAFMYRLLSAVAHGHHWAISQLAYTKGGTSASNPEMIELNKTINAKGVCLLSVSAFCGFARPLWNLARYFGWELLRLEEIIDNAADLMQMNTGPRFWRSKFTPLRINVKP